MSRRSRLQLLGLLPHARSLAPSMRPVLERGAWRFIAGLEIDADGAPNAYALPGTGLIGLDSIANAFKPANGEIPARYFGLACDPFGKPYVQSKDDPAPGYAVSQTALSNKLLSDRDPRSYVDASKVPYVVTPPELVARGVRLGDLAAVRLGDEIAFAIVADVGPHGHYGEGSPELARRLSVPASPRNGGVDRGVTYVIFPGSRSVPPWPRDTLAFEAEAARRYAAWLAA